MNKKRTIRIGIVLHPLTQDDFIKKFLPFYWPISVILYPLVTAMKPYTIKKLFQFLPVHKIFSTNRFVVNNNNIQIIAVMCPFFPEQLVLERNIAVKKICESVQILQKLGAQIVTLAGFSSIVTSGGKDILPNVTCAITSGNTLTAALTIQGVEKIIAARQLDLAKLKFLIVGATGDIGSACARYFAGKVKNMILCSRNVETNKEFCSEMRSITPNEIVFTSDIDKVVGDADVLILATSAFGFLIDPSSLKCGSVVFDVSMPPNVLRNSNSIPDNVSLVEAGRAQLSFYDKITGRAWKALFPNNSVYGCLAEGIALALNNSFVSFSIGKGAINSSKIQTICKISEENGITLSEKILNYVC